MNIQIFGTKKCFDTKKAERYFKERGIKAQVIALRDDDGKFIGYYEKHAYRNRETGKLYDFGE